jgi:hypothetical protein
LDSLCEIQYYNILIICPVNSLCGRLLGIQKSKELIQIWQDNYPGSSVKSPVLTGIIFGNRLVATSTGGNQLFGIYIEPVLQEDAQ